MSDRTPVIIGIGLSDYPKAPHLSAMEHHAVATQRALADCGIPGPISQGGRGHADYAVDAAAAQRLWTLSLQLLDTEFA